MSAPWIRMRCPWLVSIHNSPLVLEGNDGFGKAPKILPGDLFGLPQVGPHVGVAAMGEGEGRGPVNQSLDAGDRA